jgi:hypothetical protein
MKIVVGSLVIIQVVGVGFYEMSVFECRGGHFLTLFNMRRVSHNISLKKDRFVITHTIREIAIPALPDWIQAHVCWCCIYIKVQHIYLQKHNMLKCWSYNELFPAKLYIGRLRQIAVS